MDHFEYRDGRLHAEDVPVADIAATVGTLATFIPAPRSNATGALSITPSVSIPSGLLRGQGQQQLGGAERAGSAGVRFRYRVGR